MNKYLIIFISCLIVISLVFGYSYIDSINMFAEKLNRITDSALGIADFILDDDLSIMARDSYTIDFKYANLGYIENFENGIIDKAQYLRLKHMPEWFNRNIAGVTVKGSFDPYYNIVDIGIKSPVADVSSPIVLKDIMCIRYKVEITIMQLVDSIIEPSKEGTFCYEVYILGYGGDSSIVVDENTVVDINYLVLTNESNYVGDKYEYSCIASDDYNNLFEFCMETNGDYLRLNGKHEQLKDVIITNIRKGVKIDEADYANIFFAKFIK